MKVWHLGLVVTGLLALCDDVSGAAAQIYEVLEEVAAEFRPLLAAGR